MKKISEEQIDEEIRARYKPFAVESGLVPLPFTDLSDRDFELLIYCLIKEEIANHQFHRHSDIALMQGVSKRGRDCVLFEEGKVSGLIQCKNYQRRLSRPQVIRELIKFLLFSTLDNDILPNPDTFEYMLYVANDLTEPANILTKAYKDEISKYISSGDVKKYIDEIVEEYESLSHYVTQPPIEIIENLLTRISFISQNSTDLNMRVNKRTALLAQFFKVRTVISTESAENVFRTALKDFGLKFLTDLDLKKLQDRIGNTKEDDRVNLGFVDFFGFNKDFFRFLKGEKLKAILTELMSFVSLLDKELMTYVDTAINDKVYFYITWQLLFARKIHPFSVGIAKPYLHDRLFPVLLK